MKMPKRYKGVTKNDVRAYMWLSAATARGDSEASERLDLLEKQMTSEQIAKAQEANRRLNIKH